MAMQAGVIVSRLHLISDSNILKLFPLIISIMLKPQSSCIIDLITHTKALHATYYDSYRGYQ